MEESFLKEKCKKCGKTSWIKKEIMMQKIILPDDIDFPGNTKPIGWTTLRICRDCLEQKVMKSLLIRGLFALAFIVTTIIIYLTGDRDEQMWGVPLIVAGLIIIFAIRLAFDKKFQEKHFFENATLDFAMRWDLLLDGKSADTGKNLPEIQDKDSEAIFSAIHPEVEWTSGFICDMCGNKADQGKGIRWPFRTALSHITQESHVPEIWTRVEQSDFKICVLQICHKCFSGHTVYSSLLVSSREAAVKKAKPLYQEGQLWKKWGWKTSEEYKIEAYTVDEFEIRMKILLKAEKERRNGASQAENQKKK